ncbi:hypothetical protein [Streptomyces sp. WAC 06738]|uniref:hypothetical protein n=1 Tax=Streptomyces sp. WAC 06738 TaxID=2203210 RepID=UPI000F782BDF|nr:hypothetical protein [Streptomyces sp. WAC 06738]
MHNILRRGAARRVVIAEHLSGFGGQCRLASARISLSGLRQLEREHSGITPEMVARWHTDACRARTKLRREIRDRKFKRVTL